MSKFLDTTTTTLSNMINQIWREARNSLESDCSHWDKRTIFNWLLARSMNRAIGDQWITSHLSPNTTVVHFGFPNYSFDNIMTGVYLVAFACDFDNQAEDSFRIFIHRPTSRPSCRSSRASKAGHAGCANYVGVWNAKLNICGMNFLIEGKNEQFLFPKLSTIGEITIGVKIIFEKNSILTRLEFDKAVPQLFTELRNPFCFLQSPVHAYDQNHFMFDAVTGAYVCACDSHSQPSFSAFFVHYLDINHQCDNAIE
jgi:hypothetical protein